MKPDTGERKPTGHGGWRPGAGRHPRVDWQDPYLKRLREYGTTYLTCQEVGVPWATLQNELDRNPAFAHAYREALEHFADRCEETLYNQGRGTVKGNPLPLFALLKKHRPFEYHEKLVTLNTNVNVDVVADPDQARALLATMLQAATPTTLRALHPGHPQDLPTNPAPSETPGDPAGTAGRDAGGRVSAKGEGVLGHRAIPREKGESGLGSAPREGQVP